MAVQLRIEVATRIVKEEGTHKIPRESKLFGVRRLAPTFAHGREAFHFAKS